MNFFGLFANLIDMCFLVFGKTGKILNARRNRFCFIIELFCLSYWFFMDLNRGLISQGIGCLFSMMIAIYGFFNWGKNKK